MKTSFRITFLALSCIVLAACGTTQSTPTSTPAPTLSQTPVPSITPTLFVELTLPSWVTPIPIQAPFTPTPVGPYLVWSLFFDYSNEENEVFEYTVSRSETRAVLSGFCTPKTFADAWCENMDSPSYENDCELPYCAFQADLMIPLSDYSGEGYSVHLDLHGFGTVRSWIAQAGYTVNSQGLSTFCQANSTSDRNTGRYWRYGPNTVDFGEWHTFKIEVEESESAWGFTFHYSLDGQRFCSYAPPDFWDGDNRFDVIWRAVEVYPLPQGINYASETIIFFIDNIYGDYTP